MELVGEGACELRVGDRIWGGEVDGTFDVRGIDEEEGGGDSVWEGDPAHVLTAVAELAAEAETEDRQEAGEGASAAGTENYAESKVEDSDAGVDGGLGGSFPMLAQFGEKAGAEGRGLVDELVAAIAVDAGGGGYQESLWWVAEAGKGGGEGGGGEDAALGDLALVVGGPAMGGEVCTGEMDGGG